MAILKVFGIFFSKTFIYDNHWTRHIYQQVSIRPTYLETVVAKLYFEIFQLSSNRFIYADSQVGKFGQLLKKMTQAGLLFLEKNGVEKCKMILLNSGIGVPTSSLIFQCSRTQKFLINKTFHMNSLDKDLLFRLAPILSFSCFCIYPHYCISTTWSVSVGLCRSKYATKTSER